MNKSDLRYEYMRGTGPGGQHKNKTCSACRITHLPSGVSAYADERSQKHSKRSALQELKNKLLNINAEKQASVKKERRDYAIHNTPTIRTYDFSSGLVKDHRTKRTASIKDVLRKGKFDLVTVQK